jgi:hypothetical protein
MGLQTAKWRNTVDLGEDELFNCVIKEYIPSTQVLFDVCSINYYLGNMFRPLMVISGPSIIIKSKHTLALNVLNTLVPSFPFSVLHMLIVSTADSDYSRCSILNVKFRSALFNSFNAICFYFL